jgi:predicted amidophosphoribosyltransferase
MTAAVFGPCTVCSADADGNQMLCSLDAENVLQMRAVLCPRCRRRLLSPRRRLVRPRLDYPWPGWVHLGFWLPGRCHIRAWPHVRARGERLGQ